MNLREADPRELKLPKWAQEQFRVYRMEAARREGVIEDLRMNFPNDGAEVLITDYLNGDIPLRGGTRITFRLKGPHGHRRSNVRAYVNDNGALDINGDSGLIIRPGASNCFTVRMAT
ncbi:DUF7239 family protein (plasmid) [Streptomyces sp. BI20]|uniref:DUF7239 family protein n=1 Tax=Streptomyces sp. BI20 TaxID=3403460 RepID=UPI003C712F48